MEQEKPGQPKNPSGAARKPEPQQNAEVEELIRRLRSEMRLPKPSQEEMAAAVHAVQQMAAQVDAGESVGAVAESLEHRQCHACGNYNPHENRFCARCGVPLQDVPEGVAPPAAAVKLLNPLAPAAGQHHYHHHYHHHYFSSSEAMSSGAMPELRPASPIPVARDGMRARTPSPGGGISRTEAAVRKLTQDWVLACNTKNLDDLVELYAADALVLRPNVPPVRSAAAIRELLFTALEAGLGEVHFEPLRVEVLGETAYEVGRCTMLAPSSLGKRREERGKYVVVSARQSGEWKILVDCWSSDLSLAAGAEASPRTPAKSA